MLFFRFFMEILNSIIQVTSHQRDNIHNAVEEGSPLLLAPAQFIEDFPIFHEQHLLTRSSPQNCRGSP